MSVIFRRCVGAIALVCLVGSMACAADPPLDILTGGPLLKGPIPAAAIQGPESIVAVSAHWTPSTAERPAMLSVTATIEPPWYTYSLTQRPTQATPTVITVDEGSGFKLAGEFRPDLPPMIHQELGEEFETYETQVTWQAPLEIAAGADLENLKITGSARIQVCRKGECLQPTRFPFVAMMAPAAPAANAGQAGVFAPPNIHAAIRGHLDPQSVAPGGTVNLVLSAEPASGWHIYEREDTDKSVPGYKPTLIVLTNTSGFPSQAPSTSSKAVVAPSELPNTPPQHYYEGRIVWTTPITIPKATQTGKYTIAGLIGYQTCQATSCDLPIAARFEGTITVGAAGKGAVPLSFVAAKYGEAAKAAAARPQKTVADASPGPQTVDMATLATTILAALAGGFILNFMPCVLPVIGLKILSFAEQSGRHRAQAFVLNLWYSLGTMAVFMVLATFAAGANLGLRAENLAWGEQFSSTTFNVVMVGVVFAMALSFLGVWEIPIPGFVGSGAAGEVAAREGALGAFSKGALATILATPCSGPLLGAVFAYTLKQPTPVIYTIFGSIGLGMCAPYLLIGAFPHWIRFLPKPGAWMETFKEMMGFVLLGTIVFLFTVMRAEYVVPTFAMMIGLWAGCWWIGRTSAVETLPRKLKAWGIGGAFATLIAYSAFTWLTPHDSIIPWKPFSSGELARLRGEGKTVLVDFTANWCLTCKLNLATAIETDDVSKLIARNKVVPLLADWTDGSQEIKNVLESLNSRSIPLLAIFPPDAKGPIIIRDLISKGDVIEALQKAGPSRDQSKPLAAAIP